MGTDLYFASTGGERQFRDSYGNALLWRFGLVLAEDVTPLLDENDRLSPKDVKRLLQMLRKRRLVFWLNLLLFGIDGESTDKYADFQSFLNQAIQLGEPIHASL